MSRRLMIQFFPPENIIYMRKNKPQRSLSCHLNPTVAASVHIHVSTLGIRCLLMCPAMQDECSSVAAQVHRCTSLYSLPNSQHRATEQYRRSCGKINMTKKVHHDWLYKDKMWPIRWRGRSQAPCSIVPWCHIQYKWQWKDQPDITKAGRNVHSLHSPAIEAHIQCVFNGCIITIIVTQATVWLSCLRKKH